MSTQLLDSETFFADYDNVGCAWNVFRGEEYFAYSTWSSEADADKDADTRNKEALERKETLLSRIRTHISS